MGKGVNKADIGSSLNEIDDFLDSLSVAIPHMIKELKKEPDKDLTGSQRKAELQVNKQLASDIRDMIKIREETRQMRKELEDKGEIGEKKDFGGGFAEQLANS